VLPAPSPSRQYARLRRRRIDSAPSSTACGDGDRGGRRPMRSIPDQPRKSKDTLTTDIRMPPTAFGYRSIGPAGVEVPACVLSAALWTYSSNVSCLPHCRRIPTFMLTACLRERSAVTALFPLTYKEKYRDENCDYSGCNACPGDGRWCCRPSAPTARLSDGSSRQDADWQGPDREEPNRQGARRDAGLLIRGID
jgi:hypothetical protein